MACRASVHIRNYCSTELVNGCLKTESIMGLLLMHGQRVWTLQATVCFPDKGYKIVFNKSHSIYLKKKTPKQNTPKLMEGHRIRLLFSCQTVVIYAVLLELKGLLSRYKTPCQYLTWVTTPRKSTPSGALHPVLGFPVQER